MMERGDYVVPYFNARYRFDKPPLTYWCQVASYRVFGENAFAARFPSAVAAALTALVLFAWGRRLQVAQAGWWAAIIFSLCLQTFMHAKAAVADMWLVLFVTLAFWAGHELWREREKGTRGWWWVFYLSLTFAFLAKGPIGWVPLGAVALQQWFRPAPHFRRRFLFVRGMLLVLGLVALWGVPALLRTHGEFFAIGIGRHVVGRSFGTMQGHGGKWFLTLPFYFLTVFLSFAPWSVKLPWLTRRLWRGRDALDLYLVVGIALVFLIFTLVKTKLPHYTLPAFPLLSLLLARHWLATGVNLRRWSIATAATGLALALIGFPLAARYFPATTLYQKAEPDLQAAMDFSATGFEEPSLVWVFRRKIQGYDVGRLPPGKIAKFLAAPGPHFVIVPTAWADRLYPTLPSGYRKFSTRGINVAKGQFVDLTLILKKT